jgi:hypothetical protein
MDAYWSQSYKKHLWHKKVIFWRNFLRTNFGVKIMPKFMPKNVFCRNSDSKKQKYRIEKVVFLNYANAKILALALSVL